MLSVTATRRAYWPTAWADLTGAPAVSAKENAQGHRVVPPRWSTTIGWPSLTLTPANFSAMSERDRALRRDRQREGHIAYVTNWGGRLPRPGDLTLPTGFDPKADQVVVDERGIAATGTVTRIDLARSSHPHDPGRLAPDGRRLGRTTQPPLRRQRQQRFRFGDRFRSKCGHRDADAPHQRTRGVAPTALALSADGGVLYVACGGINAVAVVKTKDMSVTATSRRRGIPTRSRSARDGKHLAVGALLGAGSGWRDELEEALRPRLPRHRQRHAGSRRARSSPVTPPRSPRTTA